MTILEIIKNKIKNFENQRDTDINTLKRGKLIYIEGNCQMISRGKLRFDFIVSVNERNLEFSIALNKETNEVFALQNNMEYSWDEYVLACLYQLLDELNWSAENIEGKGIKYTRDGMMKRVLNERRQRAICADYTIELANNIYGEHILCNEKGKKYKITLRDFDSEIGYIDSIDLRTNKLGTTKHIMWLFDKLKQEPELLNGLDTHYPFVEIFLDPLNDYKITWFYPHDPGDDIRNLLIEYFGQSNIFPDSKIISFLGFVEKASTFPMIKIRPDVLTKLEDAFEKSTLLKLEDSTNIYFNNLKRTPYPYQQDGIRFATYKKGAIIADELGLGKTLQAIGAAIAKKDILGFTKTYIFCPDTHLNIWAKEIELTSYDKAQIVKGSKKERMAIYSNNQFFTICSYETLIDDFETINSLEIDFVILDETQKIKNYQTRTSISVQSLNRKHTLVLTDSPIQDKLIDLYTITNLADPYFLTPLWEFSYQHCLFDEVQKDKITGYYNLTALKNRMENIMIRRTRQAVLKQIPNIREINIPVKMHPAQYQYYMQFAHNLRQLLKKKIFNQFDVRKIMQQLNNIRLICNSTSSVADDIVAPKVIELKHIITERLSLAESGKIIIFSEWKIMNNLISSMLRNEGIAYIEIHGSISQQNQLKLYDRFINEDFKILLATDSCAKIIDTSICQYIINIEIPWDIEKRNNRLGKFDKLLNRDIPGTIINLYTESSIEESILSGKFQKHELYSNVFNSQNTVDFIDTEHPEFIQLIKELEFALTDDNKTEINTSFSKPIDELFEEVNINDGSIEPDFSISNEPNQSSDDIQYYKNIIENQLIDMNKSFELTTGKVFEFSNYYIEYNADKNRFEIHLSQTKDLEA